MTTLLSLHLCGLVPPPACCQQSNRFERAFALTDGDSAIVELLDAAQAEPEHPLAAEALMRAGFLAYVKGDAVRALKTSNASEAALFVGDDVTDERAFAKLGDDDVGVKVGDGDSAAEYRIASPAATVSLLEDLAELRGC